MKIGVVYGGRSDEAEISRRTGKAVLNALRNAGKNAVGIEATKNLPENLRKNKIDFCFIALHGKFGEDGTVQGLCEMMQIPYSGSGVLASALAMNKAAAKTILRSCGVPTADFEVAASPSHQTRLALPLVVKPVDGGSAIGITMIKNQSQLSPAIRLALKFSQSALIEKFVAGIEVTAPVLGDAALPLVEIIPSHSFYDYHAKYAKGGSRHVLPARVSKKSEMQIKTLALKAHKALGCRGFSRSDFIVTKSGKPFFLELNSVPGMTETSLFPESARAAGYAFPEMILQMIRLSHS